MNDQRRDLIAVDIGNTSLKWASFSFDDARSCRPPAEVHRLSTQLQERSTWPADLLCATSSDIPVVVASVNRAADAALESLFRSSLGTLHSERQSAITRLTNQDFPLEVKVLYPDRVGADRLASATATGRLKTPGRAAICIDAGSAVTVDLIGVGGEFLGGAILPGLPLMARSLAANTSLLPHLEQLAFSTPPPALGKSTEQAMQGGLYWSVVGAADALCRQLADEWREIQSGHGPRATTSNSRQADELASPDELPEVFVTGGDAVWLTQALIALNAGVAENYARPRAAPELALRGIAYTFATQSPSTNAQADDPT